MCNDNGNADLSMQLSGGLRTYSGRRISFLEINKAMPTIIRNFDIMSEHGGEGGLRTGNL